MDSMTARDVDASKGLCDQLVEGAKQRVHTGLREPMLNPDRTEVKPSKHSAKGKLNSRATTDALLNLAISVRE